LVLLIYEGSVEQSVDGCAVDAGSVGDDELPRFSGHLG
jgi:hypothetical protein